MNLYNQSPAFALPVVMIASVVMMMVLVSGLSATTSVNSGLRQQHNARLQKLAAEAGIAMAKACIKANSNTITWTNTSPLKPNTDCNGTETTSCPTTSTNAVCYVVIGTGYRTTFTVLPVTDGNGTVIGIDSQGKYRATRASDSNTLKETIETLKISVSGVSSTGTGTGVGSESDVLSMSANTYGDQSYPNNSGHACAIADAQLYCWGRNNVGQLGDGTTSNRSAPTLVTALAGMTVTKVKVASNFSGGYSNSPQGSTCAIADAQLYCWGERGGPGVVASRSTPTLFTELSGMSVGSAGASSNPTYLNY